MRISDWSSDVCSSDLFTLSDPYVTANVTIADMLSHRSGLRTSAGDLLEDLGYDRATILPRLARQPLEAFRTSYNYSNFGYTVGAIAAAAAAGSDWEDLAATTLFRSEEHTSELQSLMRTSYAVFCLKK